MSAIFRILARTPPWIYFVILGLTLVVFAHVSFTYSNTSGPSVMPRDPRDIAMLVLGGLLICAAIALVFLDHSSKVIPSSPTTSTPLAKEPPDPTIPSTGVEVRTSFHGFSYEDLIRDSKELTVVLNDGRSWIPAHRELLRTRLATAGVVTRVCLLHPASPYLTLLVHKNGKDLAVQVKEIRGSVSILNSEAPAWADFEVRGHDRPSPYCLYLTEKLAVVTPYFFFEAGSLPMLLIAGDSALYGEYRTDARKLLAEARPILPEPITSAKTDA